MNPAGAGTGALALDTTALLPYLIVAVGGLVVMLAEAWGGSSRREGLYGLTALALLGALAAQLAGGARVGPGLAFHGMLRLDAFARYFNILLLSIGLLTTTYATSVYDRDGRWRADFYPLLLLATFGMMVLAAASDLLALFLGIEAMSLPVYVLVGGQRGSARSSEAGIKYLLLGAFASAFMLFGMGLLYGFAGATDYAAIARAFARDGTSLLPAAGCGLVLIGLGFKVAMVPFHMWTPDVYDGAPAYVTGYMATGVKAAAFAALLRFVWLALPAIGGIWFPLLAVLAVLTMTVGNLVALAQDGIKRMLAYSSIAHAGYLLLGVLAIAATGRVGAGAGAEAVRAAAGGGVLFYLVAYTLMNLGAFAVVTLLGRNQEDEADRIAGYAGLARRQPLAAAALAVCMFSLAGIPPTAGFMAKFYVFGAAVKAGLVPLAVWGVVNSLLSVYYYLRIVVVMYMKPAEEPAYDGRSGDVLLAAALLAVLILLLGVVPGALQNLAEVTFRTMVG